MIWLHNLYQHAISIHVSSALYSLYWNTKLSSLASLTKTLGLYLLSLDRKQIYFFYGFIPKKLKWSWFIVLATTAFSRSVDHRVCDNLQKKKKIWFGEGLIYYGIEDETSSNMAVKMYGVFQSRSQGPLSSSLARILIVTNKVRWSLTEMSVGDKRTAEAMRGPVVEFLLRDHNDLIMSWVACTLIEELMLGLIKACVNDKYLQADSETRWENEHEVSGQHWRKEQDKLDLNSRIFVVESNLRYRVYGNF